MENKNSKVSFEKNVVFQTLVLLMVLSFLTWYIRYHWKRRRLYKMAKQRPGPLALPFIGSAFHFIGSNNENMLKTVIGLLRKFESPFPFWFGSKLVFFLNKPQDLEIILNSPHALEKDDIYRFIEIARCGLIIAPVSMWKRHRKIIAPTFNQKILDGFLDVFSEKSAILVTQLEKEVGKGTFDIDYYISRCAVDTICETAMGLKTGAQTRDSDFLKWVNRGLEIAVTRMFNVFYHSDFIISLTPLWKEGLDIIQKVNDFTGTVVKQKREAYQNKMKEDKEKHGFENEEQRKRTTFLEQLLEATENENFTDVELRDEVNTFMVSGSNTIAITVSFLFVALGMYPDIQQKVYEEIIEVLGPDRFVQSEDLGKLQYMERVIKETLRIFPMGPILLRAVSQDIKLEKCVIPAGSSVALCTVGLHWDQKFWPGPFKFDPDRFLPDEVAKRHPYSWLPFSGGPRNCVGIKYAFMNMKTIIALVLRRYRFYTDYKKIEDIKLKADVTMKPIHGHKVAIELRK